MLVQEIKDKLKKAMFDHDEVAKNVLRVVLGEVGTLESSAGQGGKVVTEDQIQKIIRKVILANTETSQYLKDGDLRKPILIRENEILDEFLPSLLDVAQITEKLTLVADEIKGAKSAGQAVGVAMKFFKQSGDAVDGNDVKKVVDLMRTNDVV